MEQVTEYMCRFMEKKPIVYSDLMREHDNKYIVPFKPDIEHMRFFKKIRLMNKYHYFMFFLLREVRICCYRLSTNNFETSVKYMKYTS